jgi:hypothetical protein
VRGSKAGNATANDYDMRKLGISDGRHT